MTLKNASKWMTTLSLSLVLAACGNGNTEEDTGDTGGEETTEETTDVEGTEEGSEETSGDFDTSQTIHVITREEGSGTRDAFTEIVGLLDEDENDMTYQGATIQNGTNGVMQGVSGDEYGIGYISVGSLDDSIKAVNIEGIAPETEDIQSGDYPIARNFNLAWGSDLSEPAQDFFDFIMSEEGQAVVEEEGYVAANTETEPFEGGDVEGTVSLVGSTSVTPVIEALQTSYQEVNSDVSFDVTSPGSGAGVTAAIDGTADIGMASRELDEEETEQVEDVQPIAVDGIAVVVNNANPTEDLALDDVNGIFAGDITSWDEVSQ